MLSPYGLHAMPKKGTFVQVFCNNGDSASRVAIAMDIDQFPDLEDGDVALYLPGKATIIHLKDADGSITVKTDSTVTLEANTVDVTAGVTVNGDATINGSLTVTGNSSASDHLSSGVSGRLHVHTSAGSGSPSSPPI